jgi:hypothetical protein
VNKFLALMFLAFVGALLGLGNMYCTYGIWPQSFGSLIAFTIASGVFAQILGEVLRSK